MAVAGWQYFTSQAEWKAYLQDLVAEDYTALLKSIMLIDSLQTETERRAQESTEENNVGWTKYDAKEMGEIADKLRKGEKLSAGEMAKSRNKMKKYWKQLMDISLYQQSEKRKKQQEQQREQEEKERQARIKQFREYGRVLRACAEKGKQCEYGICDECPVTMGTQMNVQAGGSNG